MKDEVPKLGVEFIEAIPAVIEAQSRVSQFFFHIVLVVVCYSCRNVVMVLSVSFAPNPNASSSSKSPSSPS
ncbi:hypothetical protein BJ508DRAFT_412619 [Ascobolus immersus RN42]|uniref:Uncharacterized protein n=1 Tax=Ascobolus immersus RN42 TaxID=1160509 RepID=A0A3N4IK40_ASCIM|nr:hypothetical protein BJ508DRAFT_412619 [Ascobolus immersus RN42]